MPFGEVEETLRVLQMHIGSISSSEGLAGRDPKEISEIIRIDPLFAEMIAKAMVISTYMDILYKVLACKVFALKKQQKSNTMQSGFDRLFVAKKNSGNIMINVASWDKSPEKPEHTAISVPNMVPGVDYLFGFDQCVDLGFGVSCGKGKSDTFGIGHTIGVFFHGFSSDGMAREIFRIITENLLVLKMSESFLFTK